MKKIKKDMRDLSKQRDLKGKFYIFFDSIKLYYKRIKLEA